MTEDGRQNAFSIRRITKVSTAIALDARRTALEAAKEISARHLTPSFIVKKRKERQREEDAVRAETFRRQTQLDNKARQLELRQKRRAIHAAQARARRRVTIAEPHLKRNFYARNKFVTNEKARRIADRNARCKQQANERRNQEKKRQQQELKQAERELKEKRRSAASYWTAQAKKSREEANALALRQSSSGSCHVASPLESNPKNKMNENARLLRHHQSTIFCPREDFAIANFSNNDRDPYLLFETSQSYRGELYRAQIMDEECAEAAKNSSMEEIVMRCQEIDEVVVHIESRRKCLRSYIQSKQQKIAGIKARLQIPYTREPTSMQKKLIHDGREKIARARKILEQFESTLAKLIDARRHLKTYEGEVANSTSTRSRCDDSLRADVCTNTRNCPPPMVLGRRLDEALSNFIDPSAAYEKIVAASKHELLRSSIEMLTHQNGHH